MVSDKIISDGDFRIDCPTRYYEFTGFSREPAFTSPTDHVGDAQLASYAAWTDIDRLGGVDGPGPWMNANVGANAVYQPIYTDHDNNPATPDQPTGTRTRFRRSHVRRCPVPIRCLLRTSITIRPRL